MSLQVPCPTKRAPDAGDSGAIPSLFLRLSIFPVGRRSAAHPSAGNANRWATRLAEYGVLFFEIQIQVDIQLNLTYRPNEFEQ